MIFDYFTISSIINALTSFIFCFFVLTRNPCSQLNRSFALFAFSVGFWAINHFLGFSLQNQTTALFFHRALMAGAIFIPSTFFHFVCVLLGIYDKKKSFIVYGYLASFIFFLSDFTPLFIPSVSKKLFFEYFENFGPMYHPFLIMFAGLTLYSHYLMFRGFKSASGARKNQIKYVFVGTLIGFIGGSTSFFLVYNIPIPPIGNCLVTVYIIMVAIAIIRHHLMDITIFAVRAIIFLIVYLIVLGIPVGLATLGKEWLLGLGNNWHLNLLLFGMALASAGPFIFMYFQRRTENSILKEQRRYQEILKNLSKTMVNIRDLDELLKTNTSTIAEAVRVSFALMYLKNSEYNSFQLKSCFPSEAKSRFQELIPFDHNLIKTLNEQERPLPSEEIVDYDKIDLDSGLVIPCFGKEGLLAIIILGVKPGKQMYTPEDILTFETLSNQTALAIENCTYWKEIEDRHRKARLQEMDAFSYSLAHEIDNPMTFVRNLARFLKEHFLKYITDLEERKEVEEMCNIIMEGSERVMGMVKAIRQFGQKTTGEFETLNLQEVIEGFFKLYAPELKANFIIYTKEIPSETIYVKGVAAELQQVLMIFSKNSIHAMKYSHEKKLALKVTKLNHSTVRVAISDTGYGIKKENLHTIFEPFFTTKASTEGTGMGLHNAKGFILRHHGRIWAESEGEGKGGTFIFELPILQDIKPDDFKKKDSKTDWAY